MSSGLGGWLANTFKLGNRAKVESGLLNKLTFGVVPADATYKFITGGSAVTAPKFIGPVRPPASSLGSHAGTHINPVLAGAGLLASAALGAGAGFIAGRLTAHPSESGRKGVAHKRRRAPSGFTEHRTYGRRRKVRSRAAAAERREKRRKPMTALQRKYFGKGHKHHRKAA